MNHAHLSRIHAVTSDFVLWQGLRLVPIGALLLLLSARKSGLWPQSLIADLVFAAAAAISVVAFVKAGRFYHRRFGHVTADPAAHERRDRIKWLLVYPLMFGTLMVDLVAAPAFFISGPVWAAAILAFWWSTGRGRFHYLAAAAVVLGLSFIQAAGWVAPGRPMGIVFLAVLGAIYIVAGTLDHIQLTRILKPVRE